MKFSHSESFKKSLLLTNKLKLYEYFDPDHLKSV